MDFFFLKKSKSKSNPDRTFTVGFGRPLDVACGDAPKRDCGHYGYTFHAVRAGSAHPAEITSLRWFSSALPLGSRGKLHQRLFNLLALHLVPSSKCFQKCSSDDGRLPRSGSRGRGERVCCVIRKSVWNGLCCDYADGVQNEQLNRRYTQSAWEELPPPTPFKFKAIHPLLFEIFFGNQNFDYSSRSFSRQKHLHRN